MKSLNKNTCRLILVIILLVLLFVGVFSKEESVKSYLPLLNMLLGMGFGYYFRETPSTSRSRTTNKTQVVDEAEQ